LSPDLRFPLIVKPNAEGSSKGIGNTNVVDTEEGLRAAVRSVLDRYRQPAIIEEYVAGREFTVGLLGDKRPRVLPPMEIRFKNLTVERPVYDFVVKQEWEKHVYYECPATLTDIERKSIEKIVRDTFWALDCRDVARIDLRMDAQGRIYVIEVNPLPGLTPNYSDLVLISRAAGLDYDQLMAEIMIGGLRRMREKRRDEREGRHRHAVIAAGNGRAAAAAAARDGGSNGRDVRTVTTAKLASAAVQADRKLARKRGSDGKRASAVDARADGNVAVAIEPLIPVTH
jgi:D-alanine-D-alanine ligase